MSHYQNSGLQQHSVGEVYPYSVVVVERSIGLGCGYCEARNLVNGQVLGRFYYNNNGPAGSFESAHRTAESACRAALAEDNAAALAAAEPAEPLTVCRLLVPIVRDDNRQRHSADAWESLREFLLDNFGGYTGRNVFGCWRNADGRAVEDESIEFEIAGSADAISRLQVKAPHIAESFGQECVYLAIASVARLYYRQR